MNFKIILMIVMTFAVVAFFSYNLTRASFTASATASNNTFSSASVFPTPTPTITFINSVVINEIMWAGNNTHESISDEWIELKNTTTNAIDLSGWKVEGAGNSTTPIATISAGIIPADGYFLVSHFDKTNTTSILDVSADFLFASMSLNNDGEQLILKKSDGSIVDKANMGPGWFAGTNISPKKSMERNNPPGDGTQIGNWHTSTGSTNLDSGTTEKATPKAVNSL